jgi:hypothetical protein
VTGQYVWFLNGGDRLRHCATLAHMVSILDRDVAVDLVCAGAYRTRHNLALYPRLPRHTYLGNILGRCWMCHQAVLYRREAFARVGPYATVYTIGGDYEYHVRCYLAGLSAQFLNEILVDYDTSGRSSDVRTSFTEVEAIHRAYRARLPNWVNWANEVIRREEYLRIRVLRRVAAGRLGSQLRPAWYRLNRWAYERRLDNSPRPDDAGPPREPSDLSLGDEVTARSGGFTSCRSDP